MVATRGDQRRHSRALNPGLGVRHRPPDLESASPPCIRGSASLRRRNKLSMVDRYKERLKLLEDQEIEEL